MAAVLHLGNVQFREDENERSHIINPHSGPIKTVAVSELQHDTISYSKNQPTNLSSLIYNSVDVYHTQICAWF